MALPAPASIVVVGVGEPFRADDGCGPAVVAAVRERLPRSARRIERVAEVTALLDLWDGVDLAIVVDAMRSGAPAGTVRRLDGADVASAAPAVRTTSSHGLSVRDAVALGTALGRMPRRLVVYLVEAGDLATGHGLSPEARQGVSAAADRVVAEAVAASAGG
jgi:hydrogenase maturation protease